jgi:hypothetical protein
VKNCIKNGYFEINYSVVARHVLAILGTVYSTASVTSLLVRGTERVDHEGTDRE